MDIHGTSMEDLEEKSLPSDKAETDKAMGLEEMTTAEGTQLELIKKVRDALTKIDAAIQTATKDDDQLRVQAIQGIRKEFLDSLSKQAEKALSDLQTSKIL
jgi:ribosomal protein S3AE